MANVFIDIAAEFTGKKAFKQADSATDKLTKNVKQLAKTFGLAFGTAQVIAYGKASIKAAAEDQKAQQQLALALKNVGLGRDAASSEAYIQALQSEFGIVDDKLRPAYQTLAVATQNTAESQRLLNLALDISASTGKDLSSVTGALSKAYLGNNTALSKLGVGISKADLKAKSFEEITKELQTTFKGSATAAANTFQGSIDKLGVAAANVSEIIGTGLIDALTNLGEDTSVAQLATNMEKTALYIADVIRGVGVLVGKLKDLPIIGNFNVGMIPILGTYLEVLREAGKQAPIQKASDNAHLKSLQSQFVLTKKTSTIKSKMTAAELAALKAARLKQAIEKGNLALLKGEEVFDMDKIQIAAALTNQAEQLGKATTSAQLLQITNDTARLNIKKSISDLEDAIASKDEAAITAATKRLNEDVKIFNALSGQNIKLSDIKGILESLKPADLINLGNLDAAIAKMLQLLALQGTKTLVPTTPNGGNTTSNGGNTTSVPSTVTSPIAITEVLTGIGSNLKEFTILTNGIANSFQTIDDVGSLNALTNLYAGGAINPFNAGSFRAAEGGSMFNSGAVGSRDINITVNTGIGDPNAIAEAIDQVLTDAAQRGTLRGFTIA